MLELIDGSIEHGIRLLRPFRPAHQSSTPADLGVDGRHRRTCVNGYAASASEYGSHAKASSPANDWTAAAGSSSLAPCRGCPATDA